MLTWATWDQAVIASLLSVATFALIRRSRPSKVGNALLPAFGEFALISALYSIWQVARQLPLTHEGGAIDRARQIDDFQQAIQLPTEIAMQRLVVDHDVLAWLANAYYATLHVPGLIVFLIWLFVRHRDRYPHWRNGLGKSVV